MSSPQVPRRIPLDPERRLKGVVTTHASLSGVGQTTAARPVPQRTGSGAAGAFTFRVVEHGDDPDVARPFATLVYWIGAAQPNNGLAYDFWYTADNP